MRFIYLLERIVNRALHGDISMMVALAVIVLSSLYGVKIIASEYKRPGTMFILIIFVAVLLFIVDRFVLGR